MSIKHELFIDAPLSDEFIDKLVLYWSLRYGSLEIPDFMIPNPAKDALLTITEFSSFTD